MTVIVPAILLGEYLKIRKIRNANFQKLTGTRRKIGLLEQIKFFLFKPKNFHVFVSFTDKKISGYMLIKRTIVVSEGQFKSAAFITEVVDEKYRNKGIAKQMIKESQEEYPVLIAEIWKDNIPSIRLHEKMGFKLTGENDNILTYTWSHNDN